MFREEVTDVAHGGEKHDVAISERALVAALIVGPTRRIEFRRDGYSASVRFGWHAYGVSVLVNYTKTRRQRQAPGMDDPRTVWIAAGTRLIGVTGYAVIPCGGTVRSWSVRWRLLAALSSPASLAVIPQGVDQYVGTEKVSRAMVKAGKRGVVVIGVDFIGN